MEEKKERLDPLPDLAAVPSFSLPPAITNFLHRDQEKQFLTGHEYYEAVLACETARAMTHRLKMNLAETVYVTTSDGFALPTAPLFKNGRSLGVQLADLTEKLDRKRENMIEAMSSPPIIEKFLGNMNATEGERKVFRYVLVAASGMIPNSKDNFDRYGMAGRDEIPRSTFVSQQRPLKSVAAVEIHDILGHHVSLSDIMSLTAVQSKWVKEQIYERSSRPTNQMSAMADDTILTFMGADLTLAQYQEIESQVLQKTLLEDERFRQTETGKVVMQQQEQVTEFPDQSDLLQIEEEDFGASPAPLAEALSALTPTSEATKVKDRVFKALVAATEQNETTSEAPESTNMSAPEENHRNGDLEFGPYQSDLDYLEDQIRLMDKHVGYHKAKAQMKDDGDGDDPLHVPPGMGRPRMGRQEPSKDDIKLEKGIQAEKIEIKLKKLRDKIGTRLRATKKQRNYTPRLEQLREALSLDQFEKFVILDLVRMIIMPFHYDTNDEYGYPSGLVATYIERFANSLEDKMHSRKFFYKSSTLIKEGIITISHQDFMTDLNNCRVELDRRMFDFIIGLDTEFSELVNGSHLYTPDVSLDDVVLPQHTKKRICDSVMNFEKTKDEIYRLEIDQKITYGVGQVLLFYGSSGTGKTMMANAIAAKLKKKVLLVNFPTLGDNTSGELIKFLFREARINKALLFFDECESLFKSRELGGCSINMILTELERFDDLCILATNRPCDLDEAMYRRISLAIEFKKPDHILREEIWKTLHPPKLALDSNVDYNELARKFELAGGFIKNAWLQSVGLMVQRGGDTVTHQDLVQAASEQVRGRLSLEDFDRRVVATSGIESVVSSPQIKESLHNIVHHAKAQTVLFGQWGFGKVHRAPTGISALFCGQPGTGKTMSSEAIGFDLGCPLKVVNTAELVSKYVGDTGKNIQSVFDDAKAKNSVIVFDEAEGLFGKRSQGEGSGVERHDTINVGLLLHYIENFSGVCIVITNQKEAIDEAFLRRFRFVLNFERPDPQQRELLWKSIIPAECPLATDVSLQALAHKYDLCGGDIKSAVFRAAVRAALRVEEKERVVFMEDLEDSCIEEMKKASNPKEETSMYA